MKTDHRPFRALAVASVSALSIGAGSAWADQVIADDLIVQGSLCTGLDCANGENFGFDTVRLKENNTRLHFLDTSNSSSFPTADWRLIANDSSNGGLSYLGIEDSDAGRITFRVEQGAPLNALYVSDAGDIGVKTGTPVVDLHVVEGNTPTLRLEQDGSDGFTPQTWDLAGNEANFFLRDVTNGSKLPFRVKPNAPSNSISVIASGYVGMGIETPTDPLHVRRSDGTAKVYVQETNAASQARALLELENNGGSVFRMDNSATGDSWVFAHEHAAPNRFVISVNGGAHEFVLDQAGNLTLAGTLTTSGSCSVGCDAVFDEGFAIPAIGERAAMMYDLGYLPNVGPTAEKGQYDLTAKMLGMLNELEHAHIYIAQLNDRVAMLEQELGKAQD